MNTLVLDMKYIQAPDAYSQNKVPVYNGMLQEVQRPILMVTSIFVPDETVSFFEYDGVDIDNCMPEPYEECPY